MKRIIRDQSDIRAGLEELALLDPRLVSIIERAGPVPLRLNEPGFAGIASIIVSQMVSRASADAIWRRITAAGPVTAEHYAALAPEVIATFGLSRAKAATLSHLASALVARHFDLEAVGAMEADEALKALTSLPGIGPWTAEVYLMFCCGHADVFPSGDVALQAAVRHAFAMDERPPARQLARMAEVWTPWRSVAARLFWAYYASEMRRQVAPITESPLQ
ncbi:DNA-3-methyladenine glycosylase family protein [Neorhizobium sp. SOG26]|uniref:DNA-3-methyladenine glycosylase family protein n=1 Tax=Neorhizobium sp. SOG26 TaxID=2060726 RepID=UPI001FE0EB3E|nr:DNA-3-methyladenine glycosylase [Neorhizobium sp. SOG26]